MSSCRITPEINEKLQEIIESVAKLPCACPFLEPVNPDDESTRTYYKKIKEPIDLSLIKMRLLLKKYQYVSDLQADMNLILKNSRTFNGPSHFITQLAEILIKNFEKMLYAIFPMSVRMWVEKVGELTWKIQNLFVNTKMPNFIESDSIISATIMQALEQHDSLLKQAMFSSKFNKPPHLKNSKSFSNAINNFTNASDSNNNDESRFNPNDIHFSKRKGNVCHFDNNENHKRPCNNSFVIPVIQSVSPSILKTPSPKISLEDNEISRPSFIPSPIEPIFIPFPTSQSQSNLNCNSSNMDDSNANNEVTKYYMNHFYDYGYNDEIKQNILDIQPEKKSARNSRRRSYRDEEEDKSDDFFIQLDYLSFDYHQFDDDDYDEASTEISNSKYDVTNPLQDRNDQSNEFSSQKQIENQNDQEQQSIQKPNQKRGNSRKPILHKSQEIEEYEPTESKRRGRPKKIKIPTDGIIPEKGKKKAIDKNSEKVKAKDKTKDKAKDKSKAKTKNKEKTETKDADEKPVKNSKRIPKETKEKRELKEMKEPKGRKYPKKLTHVRKTKSDSDFHTENDLSSPTKCHSKASEDHVEPVNKKKTQPKRQSRKNLSADEENDEDFFPVGKVFSQSTASSGNYKKKNGRSGRHKKSALDDDEDYQYGADNDDDNDLDANNITPETLTDGHMLAFMLAAHQLNQPNDQKEMAAIIHLTEPQILFTGAYPVIDITKLKATTLIALIKYTKKKFKERGKDYPLL